MGVVLIWIVVGIPLLVIGVVSFARAGRLAGFLSMYRSPRPRADTDRVLLTITGFRIISALLTDLRRLARNARKDSATQRRGRP